MKRTLPSGLYGMADAAFGDPVPLSLALAAGGCGVVQLRAKGWSTRRRTRAARAIVEALRPLGVLVIVNDDVQAALQADAAGVHLGQDDGPLQPTRDLLGPVRLIGRSTHSLQEVDRAVREGADYLGFGPVFETGTKPDAQAVVGTALLASAVARSACPVVAIGGITAGRLPAVRDTGVHGWAIVSDLLRHAAAGDAAGHAALTEAARALC